MWESESIVKQIAKAQTNELEAVLLILPEDVRLCVHDMVLSSESTLDGDSIKFKATTISHVLMGDQTCESPGRTEYGRSE